MKIGILGSGTVARTLAAGFLRHGHAVTLGTRNPTQLAIWQSEHPQATLGSFADAATFGDVLVLAVKGTAAESALAQAGAENLAGKPIIDATNPIADAPPAHGVLPFFTTPADSLLERLQHAFPQARLVKAFSSVGAGLMVNPQLEGGSRPTMFICGNDPAAKATIIGILQQFGWEAADMGEAPSARAIEPLCMLWCLPGLLRNDWNHGAFKLLKAA